MQPGVVVGLDISADGKTVRSEQVAKRCRDPASVSAGPVVGASGDIAQRRHPILRRIYVDSRNRRIRAGRGASASNVGVAERSGA